MQKSQQDREKKKKSLKPGMSNPRPVGYMHPGPASKASNAA